MKPPLANDGRKLYKAAIAWSRYMFGQLGDGSRNAHRRQSRAWPAADILFERLAIRGWRNGRADARVHQHQTETCKMVLTL